MKAKNAFRKLGAAAVAALVTLSFTTAQVRAGHDALFSAACDLASVTDTLLCDYTNELKYTHRWEPCGIDKELFDAVSTLEKCANHVHESLRNRCGFEELQRHVCETRAAADRVEALACRTRLSRRIRARIAESDRLLCAIESGVAEQAQARAFEDSHAGHHHGHGAHAHTQPVPTAAPPAAIPHARSFRSHDRAATLRFFFGSFAGNHWRR